MSVSFERIFLCNANEFLQHATAIPILVTGRIEDAGTPLGELAEWIWELPKPFRRPVSGKNSVSCKQFIPSVT